MNAWAKRKMTWLERREILRKEWLQTMRTWALEWRRDAVCSHPADAQRSLNQALRARRMAREVYA